MAARPPSKEEVDEAARAEAAARAARAGGSASAAPKELTEDELRQVCAAVLAPMVEGLRNREWKGWGNPFRARLTPETVVALGIPHYFSRVPLADTMDLHRMHDRCVIPPGATPGPEWEGGPAPSAFRSVDEAGAAVRQMAANAAAFNGPLHKVSKIGSELVRLWERSERRMKEEWRKTAAQLVRRRGAGR